MSLRMRIGDLDVVGISDGLLKTSVDFVIGMEREQAKTLVGANDDGTVFIPVNNFVFARDGAIVLIDAGAGDTMQSTLGKLPGELRGVGINPQDVTHVVITHLHPDHANGLVDDAGEAVYPTAQILVHAVELDFWMGPGRDAESPAVKRMRARNAINLRPYMSRVQSMQDGQQILGCSPLLAAGHSPGHSCWRIVAGSATLLAWGDCVHFSGIQIENPDIAVTYDLNPESARLSRLRVLELAATEKMIIAGAHVAAPGVGRIVRRGSGFVWAAEP